QNYTNKNYPGLSLLNKGLEYFDHFTTRLDNITYFNKLVEMEDDLIQWDDDFETVKDFFESNQKHLFDQGLAILERYEQNKSFFENEMNEAIGKSIKELKDILENPIPYSEIKDIPGLVESFNQAFEVILEDRKDETKDNLQNDFNSLKEFGNQEGVSDSTKSNIQRIWSNYLSEIDSTTDIYRVDGLIIQSERSKTAYLRKMNQEISAFNKENKEEYTEIVEESKVVEQVKITNLMKPTTLTTSQDVEVFVNQLSNKLKQSIQMNHIIEIVD